MIVELCHRLSKEDVLIPETVNEICDNYIGRQVREIDMSFILLFVMGGGCLCVTSGGKATTLTSE